MPMQVFKFNPRLLTDSVLGLLQHSLLDGLVQTWSFHISSVLSFWRSPYLAFPKVGRTSAHSSDGKEQL